MIKYDKILRQRWTSGEYLCYMVNKPNNYHYQIFREYDDGELIAYYVDDNGINNLKRYLMPKNANMRDYFGTPTWQLMWLTEL